MTSDEVYNVLVNASEALSHASYCAITHSVPEECVIESAWRPFRELIRKIKPDNLFIEPDEEGWVKPSLKIEEIKHD